MVGLTRVGWVRVELGPDGPSCQLVGTYRHRVVTRRISVATATGLITRGVPSVIRHREGHRPVPARA
jgi:hypothetical protein